MPLTFFAIKTPIISKNLLNCLSWHKRDVSSYVCFGHYGLGFFLCDTAIFTI